MYTNSCGDQRCSRALLSAVRDQYHNQYQIRTPSSSVPDYQLPARPIVSDNEHQSLRFLSLRPTHGEQHNTPAKNLKRQWEAASTTEPTPCLQPCDFTDLVELPATVSISPMETVSLPFSGLSIALGDVANICNADVQANIAELETKILEAEKRIMQGRVDIVLNEECVRKLRDEVLQLHVAGLRQHVGGEDSSAQKRGSAPANEQAQSTSTHVPSFMKDFLPAPGLNPPDPNDDLNTRRCTVGRKILHPGRDRYYSQSKCDKHANTGLFVQNMSIYSGGKERDYAWKCS
jgi:hypothetical protein